MTFKDDMVTDLVVLFNEDEFAIPAIYITAGAVNIKIIVDYLNDPGIDIEKGAATRVNVVMNKHAFAPHIVAEMDELYFDGKVWRIERVERADDDVVVVNARWKEGTVYEV